MAAFMLNEPRNVCAGLTEWLADVDRRDVRLVLGIFVALDIRIDRALEFLLSGFSISSVGDTSGDTERSIGFPSGIVFGGDIVVLPVRLPILLSSPVVSVGEAKMSLLGDIVDADVRDAAGCAGGTLWVAVSFWTFISISVTASPSDWFSYHRSINVYSYLIDPPRFLNLLVSD